MSGGHDDTGGSGQIVRKIFWGIATAGAIIMVLPGAVYATFRALVADHPTVTMFFVDMGQWPLEHVFTYFACIMFCIFLVLILANKA